MHAFSFKNLQNILFKKWKITRLKNIACMVTVKYIVQELEFQILLNIGTKCSVSESETLRHKHDIAENFLLSPTKIWGDNKHREPSKWFLALLKKSNITKKFWTSTGQQVYLFLRIARDHRLIRFLLIIILTMILDGNSGIYVHMHSNLSVWGIC